MPGICRAGVDSAGGILINTQTSVFANGQLVIVDGDPVTPHGDSPHSSATMTAGVTGVFVGGVAVCKAGDLATCGHAATGSSDVNVGG